MADTTGTQHDLDALLEAAGSPYQGEALDDILAGIAGAPPNNDWFDLIGAGSQAHLSARLSEELEAVREVRRAAAGLDGPKPPASRLAELREELRRRGVDGFIIPRVDEHMGEYVPPQASRLEWLTGFSGSAGSAAVTADAGAIFVDGRYTLQVAHETDLVSFEHQHLVKQPVHEWVKRALGPGQRLGLDPWLHTMAQAQTLEEACQKVGASLVMLDTNPVDTVWQGQPARPISPIRVHSLEHAGKASSDKRRELAEGLRQQGVGAAVLTLPDSICWMLNVRGGDLPHNPMVLAMALLQSDDAGTTTLFVDPRKVSQEVRDHLGDDVVVAPPEHFETALNALRQQGTRVLVDPKSAPCWIATQLDRDQIVEAPDPTLLPKACKNAVELEGTREAHKRDGVAVTRFLAWLDAVGPSGQLTELEAAAKLRSFREETGALLDLSFETISGSGPNGAIVHYRVTPATNRTLGLNEIYLVDSGGQYADGTTDITRTVVIGTPSDEMKDRFTRVLQGHIALACARFPHGTTGAHLDVLARQPLWNAGLDYDHGTGHGVGSYLCVHEGPQRISKAVNTVPLAPGMIISNEPGYYKTDAYGIRIENLVAVRELPAPPGAERSLMGFETLTLAPIDRRLIDGDMLSPHEKAWVDAYHQRVADTIGPRLDAATRAWLEAATAPL